MSATPVNSRSEPEKLIGVAAAIKALEDPNFVARPEIFNEFSLKGRVAVVTGGNGDLGLEMALGMCEAGATVYCLDLPEKPSSDLEAASKYAVRLGSRLVYRQCNVIDQQGIWAVFEDIANAEGRLDICITAAGILQTYSALDYPAEEWRKVMDVKFVFSSVRPCRPCTDKSLCFSANGVFFSAQAAARQMAKAGNGGSIILIASMSGSITNRGHPWTAYNTSKSAVLQMARSLACELGPQRIRVNSLSPGHIYTKLV
jgi:NAD(P)-dependent dehydrogenase (short-subunit alcohol dehydrogenase family)